MPGNEAYLAYVEAAGDAAQQKIWTFYDAVISGKTSCCSLPLHEAGMKPDVRIRGGRACCRSEVASRQMIKILS